MELMAASSAYHHLSTPAAAAARDADADAGDNKSVAQLHVPTTTTTEDQQQQRQQLARRSRNRKQQGVLGCAAGLRRRCYAVLKQQRTRLYILRRCVTMLLCWHRHDLSD